MKRKLLPNVVEAGEVVGLPADATVAHAVKLMADHGIGALAILDQAKLTHIFTERDVLVKVVAAGRDPQTTTLGEVATPDPDTLPPNAEAWQALQKMRERRYRHMPVVDNGNLVAMVSIRDLHEAALSAMQDEIRQREEMLFGTADGLA